MKYATSLSRPTSKAPLSLGANNLADTVSGLMSGQIAPQGKVTSEVSSAILTPFFYQRWKTVETTLPYVRPFLTRIQQEGLDTENILTKEGAVNPGRVDHYANRQLWKPPVPPVDKNHPFPQFHPLAGDIQTRLPLTMVGMQPVGDRITFPERAVKGGGYISKSYPEIILPRWFTSGQNLDDPTIPKNAARSITASIRGAETPLYDKTDWELLIAADAGKPLSLEECHYLGTVTLPKMLQRNYTPGSETLSLLREAEQQRQPWAEYTRNCYERGPGLNHGTIPVSDIPKASVIMRSLGIPTVPDQGVGTQLEQGAAGSADYPLFLEYIHRIQGRTPMGELLYYPNGEPIWKENAFNFNANGIFAATSQESYVGKLQAQAWRTTAGSLAV